MRRFVVEVFFFKHEGVLGGRRCCDLPKGARTRTCCTPRRGTQHPHDFQNGDALYIPTSTGNAQEPRMDSGKDPDDDDDQPRRRPAALSRPRLRRAVR